VFAILPISDWSLLLNWAESRDDKYQRKSPYLLYSILLYLKESKHIPFVLTDADQIKIEKYIEILSILQSPLAPKLATWLSSSAKDSDPTSPAVAASPEELFAKFPNWRNDPEFLSLIDRATMKWILEWIAQKQNAIFDLYDHIFNH
jgi:hypothetical protein